MQHRRNVYSQGGLLDYVGVSQIGLLEDIVNRCIGCWFSPLVLILEGEKQSQNNRLHIVLKPILTWTGVLNGCWALNKKGHDCVDSFFLLS